MKYIRKRNRVRISKTHKELIVNKHAIIRKEHPLNKLFGNFWDFDLTPFSEENLNNISLSEDEEHVYVEASLPGLSESEIEITLERGVLWIKGNKSEEKDDSKRKYHYRTHRSYSYKVYVPESVDDASNPDAEYKKGVLHITFAKTKQEAPKKISIRSYDK